MKTAIISDIHANQEALEAVVRDISRQGVDRIVCLGDIVGYNANPAECLELLRDLGALCVAGNHDRAVAGRITTEGFSERAARGVCWTRKRLGAGALRFLADLPLEASLEDGLVVVHGALGPHGGCEKTYLDTDERRESCIDALRRHPSGARICAYGHTHELAVFEFAAGSVRACDGDEVSLRDDCYYLINPGTVGEPRHQRERRATYLLLDTSGRTVSVRRVDYDHTACALKTRKAGLGPRQARVGPAIGAIIRWGARRLGLHGSLARTELTSVGPGPRRPPG